MIEKVLIPLHEDHVAPRFDLVTDALVVAYGPAGEVLEERTVVLAHAAADELCKLILTENVKVVVCGGIEEEYYQYLSWKKVRVVDSVIGPARDALARLRDGSLRPAAVLAAGAEA